MQTAQPLHNPCLHICMLGSFTIMRGEEDISPTLKNSRQLSVLLKVLLARRGRPGTLEELMDILWEGQEYDNEAKILQNLIYRLRKTIDGGSGQDSYIVRIGGGYAWNTAAPYTLDVEEFERLADAGLRSCKQGRGDMQTLREAVSLYTNDFLSDYIYDQWTIPYRQTLKQKYIGCVDALLQYLREGERYADIAALCEAALSIDPLDEGISIAYMQALVAMQKNTMAVQHYSQLTERLYRELGIPPSKELKAAYAAIHQGGNYLLHDIDGIARVFKDADTFYGPFFCDEELFNALYKFELRKMRRDGQASCLMLLTLARNDLAKPGKVELDRAMDALKQTLISSLRSSDIVCIWNESQALVLLTLIAYEDSFIVAKRLQDKYLRAEHGNLLLHYKAIAVTP